MEFTLFYKNDRLETKMFSWKGENLPDDSDIKGKSRVKFIAAWFSYTIGTFGLTMKPKLMQIMSKTQENEFETFILNDDEGEGLECEKPVILKPDIGYDENDYESLV